MSSYIMHMCVSDIVKRKLNLTDKFIYGSVLPDIVKGLTGDRNRTHYLEKVEFNGETRNLPNITRAIKELDIQDREIRLGYIAHLVEDLIWFREYTPSYARILPNNQMEYINQGIICSSEQFGKDIYSDYSNSGAYVIDKCDTDIEELKDSLGKLVKDKAELELILQNTRYTQVEDIDRNIFMTRESVDKYIQECTKEVEKIVRGLMGE